MLEAARGDALARVDALERLVAWERFAAVARLVAARLVAGCRCHPVGRAGVRKNLKAHPRALPLEGVGGRDLLFYLYVSL